MAIMKNQTFLDVGNTNALVEIAEELRDEIHVLLVAILDGGLNLEDKIL